jgi:hypothetical protein
MVSIECFIGVGFSYETILYILLLLFNMQKDHNLKIDIHRTTRCILRETLKGEKPLQTFLSIDSSNMYNVIKFPFMKSRPKRLRHEPRITF